MPRIPARRFIRVFQPTTLLCAISLLAGCAVTSPDLSEPFSQPTISDDHTSAPPQTSPADFFRDNDRIPIFWLTEEPLRLDLSATAPAAEPSASATIPQENLFSLAYVHRLGRDIKGTFSAPARWETGDWLLTGGVAAGVGVTMAFDREIQRAVQRNRNGTINHIFQPIGPFGNEYSFAVLGAFYLGGEIFDDDRAKSVTLDGLSASLIASGLITQPSKYIIGRSRPGDSRNSLHFQPFSGRDSFPSGHATQAFAVATVIAEHYEQPWIKVASYTLASAVAYSRVNSNSHWASDVLAGAAIGIFVGQTVVHLNPSRTLTLTPIAGPDVNGVQLTWSY